MLTCTSLGPGAPLARSARSADRVDLARAQRQCTPGAARRRRITDARAQGEGERREPNSIQASPRVRCMRVANQLEGHLVGAHADANRRRMHSKRRTLGSRRPGRQRANGTEIGWSQPCWGGRSGARTVWVTSRTSGAWSAEVGCPGASGAPGGARAGGEKNNMGAYVATNDCCHGQAGRHVGQARFTFKSTCTLV